MNIPLSTVRTATAALILTGVLSACGGADPDDESETPPAAADAAQEAADDAQIEAAPIDGGDVDENAEETSDPPADPTATSDVDLDTAPDPDPSASAEDYPDFEGAFEQGRYAGSYGRADYYEPSTVRDPGSMAGVKALEAYRAGFSLGLAEYEAQIVEAEAAKESAEAEAAANYPVGHLIEGWDPKVAVSEFWEIEGAESCDTAAATDPCLDVWRSDGNTVITALGRLDPAAGAEPDHALLMSSTARGYEVQDAWDATADPATPAPDWTQRPG